LYKPEELVVAAWLMPVEADVAVTVAFGTAAPPWSRTCPVMLPVCAEADRPNKKITASRTIPGRRVVRKRFIAASPKLSLTFFPCIFVC
jgi:hypothetical protein